MGGGVFEPLHDLGKRKLLHAHVSTRSSSCCAALLVSSTGPHAVGNICDSCNATCNTSFHVLVRKRYHDTVGVSTSCHAHSSACHKNRNLLHSLVGIYTMQPANFATGFHVQNTHQGDTTPPRRPSSSSPAHSGYASALLEVSSHQQATAHQKSSNARMFHLNTVGPRAGPGTSQNWVMVIRETPPKGVQ